MSPLEKKSLLLLTLTICCSCQQNLRESLWENAPVAAKNMEMADGTLIDFDPTLLQDTIIFPISYFIEEIEIVRLDNREEAIVSPSQKVYPSENYILLKDYRNIPCKLFDKKGKFISNIGAIGNGPGEYTGISTAQIDEKNNRIYLSPHNTENILVFDLTGKMLDPIKLPRKIRELHFRIKEDIVEIVCVPNPSISSGTIWKQNFAGEVIDTIPTPGFEFQRKDFILLNSVYLSDSWSVSFPVFRGKIDSVYYVDFDKNKLIPCFTMNFGNRELQAHFYQEWPDHFVGSTSELITIATAADDGTINMVTTGEEPAYYIVDKKTLKGSFFKIENDYFGGVPVDTPPHIFHNGYGYYTRNMDPGDMEEWLVKILLSEKLEDKMRQQLTTILNNIDENDNNYILYAKMK